MLPEYGGTGLSKALLDKVFDYVEELKNEDVMISRLILFVNAVQYAAQKFYKRSDFELTQQADIPVFEGLSCRTVRLYEKKLH